MDRGRSSYNGMRMKETCFMSATVFRSNGTLQSRCIQQLRQWCAVNMIALRTCIVIRRFPFDDASCTSAYYRCNSASDFVRGEMRTHTCRGSTKYPLLCLFPLCACPAWWKGFQFKTHTWKCEPSFVGIHVASAELTQGVEAHFKSRVFRLTTNTLYKAIGDTPP